MRKISVFAALAALVLLSACGSSGLGDLGGIFGTPQSSSTGTGTTQSGSVGATVNFVDTTAQRIDVNINYVNNLRQSQGNGNQSIYYDSRTKVVYNGNTGYNVADLERGDQISVTGYQDNNNRFVADTITVTRNVRG